MTDDATPPASPPDRAKHFVGRVKATPSRIEWLFANQEDVNAALRETREALAALGERLDRLQEQAWAQRDDTRGGVTALGDEFHKLRGHLDHRLDSVAATVASHAQTLHRAVATPARDAERARLVAELGPPAPLRAGLSIFTICWNHGGLLAESVRSGLAVLDALPPQDQGQLLVLDDASSDETATVAASLAEADPRVRVITARANLGLARARNVLLHAAPTTHAFQLDADNTATPAGVAALLQVARTYRAAFTYGNVLKQGPDGEPAGVMSNEPITEPWFRGNYVDTMAVVDVVALRPLGGWPEDPVIEHVDDWALVHRLARDRQLIAFVPVVAGRYRALAHAFHLSVPDVGVGPDRVARTFNPDGALHAGSVAALAAHPDLGVLWASPAVLAARPDLAPVEPDPIPEPTGPRLLVVGPGGVANLGDDAIVHAALTHLAHHLPHVLVDLVTDGPEPVGIHGRAVWLGPLLEVVRGLTDSDLPAEPSESLAAAAVLVGTGTQPRRPLDPADYDAALFVGGGSLTSQWGDTLVAPRALLAAALVHAGVPYRLSGQGIGPLEGADVTLVAELVDAAEAVAVRDAGSADLVTRIAADAPVQRTGDDALLLPPAPAERLAAALHACGASGPYLAFTVREADYVGTDPRSLEALAAAVDAVAHTRGLTVVGVALNEHRDAPEAVTLARLAQGEVPRAAPWRVLECGHDAGLLAAAMAGADLTVAHSYHAALFALAAGTPALLVARTPYYRSKAQGLAALAGLPDELVLSDERVLSGTASSADLAQDLTSRLDAVAHALTSGAGLDPARRAVQDWWSQLTVVARPT